MELLMIALLRKRKRLVHKTVYTYNELKKWLEAALPGWTTYVSSVMGDRALSSRWPAADDIPAVEKWLEQRGCDDPNDLVEGACEPLGMFLADQALHRIQSKSGEGGLFCHEDLHEQSVAMYTHAHTHTHTHTRPF